MTPLARYLLLSPEYPSDRMRISSDKITYLFPCEDCAKAFEREADRIIKENGLSLVVEKWSYPKRRIEVEIREVPEEMEFMADEDERYGGWWGPAAENEVWERQE